MGGGGWGGRGDVKDYFREEANVWRNFFTNKKFPQKTGQTHKYVYSVLHDIIKNISGVCVYLVCALLNIEEVGCRLLHFPPSLRRLPRN